MGSEYQIWFSENRKDGSFKGISNDTFLIFESFLNENITAADTVDRFVVSRNIGQGDARTHLFSLTIRAAEAFPEAHGILIDILKEIFVDPSTDATSFGWMLRDAHDCLQSQVDEVIKAASSSSNQPRSDSLTALVIQWANFYSFSAKCHSAGALNMGVGFLLPAVEQSLEAKASTSRLGVEVYTLAAAAWLTYASPAVLALCLKDSPPGFREVEPAKRLWKGPDGFSIGRWDFWKERLEAVEQQFKLSEDAAALMRQALVAMGKAERAKKGKK